MEVLDIGHFDQEFEPERLLSEKYSLTVDTYLQRK
jgi:hypothetical protein